MQPSPLAEEASQLPPWQHLPETCRVYVKQQCSLVNEIRALVFSGGTTVSDRSKWRIGEFLEGPC